MSRTGASTSRTSKLRAKSTNRKPAKKVARSKRAAPAGRTRRAKPAVKPKTRHKIRTRGSSKPTVRRGAVSRVAKPRLKQDAPVKRKTASVKTADDTKAMKRTISHQSKIAAEVKEKRKPATKEPSNVRASAPPKETKPRVPKLASPPAPPKTSPEPLPLHPKQVEEDVTNGTRAKSVRGPRSNKTFRFDDDLMQDYVMDDDVGRAGLDEELTIEPLELPLELLDPELVDVPRPVSPPKPKPKPVAGKRQQKCANCGTMYAWLSVEQLCFVCLKKKLAQRKREDETYPGFTGEPEEEEEAS